MAERFKKDYEGDRLRTVKTAFLLAYLIEQYSEIHYNPWLTIDDLTRLYRDTVGRVSRRTIHRYVGTLDQIGIIESRKVPTGNRGADRTEFRFVSYRLGA